MEPIHYRESGIPLVDEDFSKVLSKLPLPLYNLIQLAVFEGINDITASRREAPANIRYIFLIHEGRDILSSFTILVQPNGVTIRSKAMDGAPNTQSNLVALPKASDNTTIKVMLWLDESQLRWLEMTVTSDHALLDAMFACVPESQRFVPPQLQQKNTAREKIREIWAAIIGNLVKLK